LPISTHPVYLKIPLFPFCTGHTTPAHCTKWPLPQSHLQIATHNTSHTMFEAFDGNQTLLNL
jgi:hypothetical protein